MTGRRDAFERLKEPQTRGDAAEAIVTAELVTRGLSVLVPESDNEPYDLVVDASGSFDRVQVKTAYPVTDGTIRFETRSTRVKSEGYEREGYAGKIDYFAVYGPPTDRVYVVPIDETSTAEMRLRYEEAKNNQRARVNWHEDYLLAARISDLAGLD